LDPAPNRTNQAQFHCVGVPFISWLIGSSTQNQCEKSGRVRAAFFIDRVHLNRLGGIFMSEIMAKEKQPET
jgi:hypothetical protein